MSEAAISLTFLLESLLTFDLHKVKSWELLLLIYPSLLKGLTVVPEASDGCYAK